MPWKQLLVEGFVVVVSILLAFAIDAGWDMRQAAAEDRQLLRALVTEIEANREEFQYRRSQGEGVRRAHTKLIDLIGPQPEILSVDSLGQLFRTSMSFGTVEIESAALDALIASSSAQTDERRELLRLLRRYRTELDDHRSEDRPQWIDQRANLMEHLVEVSPFAFVWGGSRLHEPTDFEVPVESLLRDQQLEGLVSALSLRASQMVGKVESLTAIADSIMILASDELR